MKVAARPPRALVAASVVVLVIATVLAVLGAFRTGITTDEPIHVMRLRNFFDNGWFALDWDYRGGGPGSSDTNTFVYAPVAMLLLHVWSVLWGTESWGEVSTSAHAYDIRHLGVVMIGLVCLVAVAAIGRVVLRSWQWGIVAAAFLAAIPMWTGHEMFNVKDIPVATGYTLATLGLLLFLREHSVRHETPRRAVRLGRAVVLAAGLVLCLGTRPGMWPGLFAVLLIAFVAGRLAAGSWRAYVVPFAELAGACLVAAVALVGIYPNLFGHPLTALPRTSESSSSFLDGLKADRMYVPRHLAEEMPTLLLVFVLTGMTVGLLFLLRSWRTEPVRAGRIALIGVQTAAMPVAAMVMGSDLYHGLRQLLFAAPTSAVLGAYGIAWWWNRAQRPGRRQVWRRVLPVAAVAALALPLVDQITLQPFQTTYVNLATDALVSGHATPETRPGGDYWRVSLPGLVDDADPDNQMLCKSLVTVKGDIAYRFTNGGTYSTTRSLDCREEPNGPLWPSKLALPAVNQGPTFDAVFVTKLPKNCTNAGDVTRMRHGFEVVMSILGRCTVAPSPLSTTGVTADNPALGTAGPGDLWTYAVDGWEQWPGKDELHAPVPSAQLAFKPDAACQHNGCLLSITGIGPSDLVATIDGVRVPASRHSPTIQITVPANLAHPNGVWVDLTRAGGGVLDLQMTGLRLEGPLAQGDLGPIPTSTEGNR